MNQAQVVGLGPVVGQHFDQTAVRQVRPHARFRNLRQAKPRQARRGVGPGSESILVQGVRRTLETTFQAKAFDQLVNNAGFAQRTLLQDTTEAQFDQLNAVHFKGPFFLTQKLVPLMNDGGQIINISIGLTRFSHPGVAAYAAMKAALECLTVYQAKEYGARKIRANAVAPGAIQSDFGGGKTEEADRIISGQTALGRLGQVDDVGKFVAAMLSDDSGWVTAQRIEVSGGMYI